MTKKQLGITAAAALLLSAIITTYIKLDGPRHLTEARCKAGAFITPTTQSGDLVADGDNDKQPGDNVALHADLKSTATGPNLIPNSALEDLTEGKPTGWDVNSSGSNKADFNLVDGYNSQTAIRASVSEHKNGSADWFYQPISVEPGKYYEYEGFYRSNIPTRASVSFKHNNGSTEYVDLHSAPAAADWTRYIAKFIVPSDVKEVAVYHPVTRNGYIDIDNPSLRSAELKGFDEPMMSITFDDGWKSIHDNALPLLKKYNLPSTQYLISGYFESPQYMSTADAYDFRAAGSEIASHTVDHLDLTTQTPDIIEHELELSYSNLSKCFGKIDSFAAPYGAYNEQSVKTMEHFYSTARSTDDGYNTADSLLRYGLKVKNMELSTTPEQLREWVETAKSNNVWLILVYHQADESSEYGRSPQSLENDFQIIKESGVRAVTVKDGWGIAQKNINR